MLSDNFHPLGSGYLDTLRPIVQVFRDVQSYVATYKAGFNGVYYDKDYAEDLGIRRATLSNILNENSKPNTETLQKLSHYCETFAGLPMPVHYLNECNHYIERAPQWNIRSLDELSQVMRMIQAEQPQLAVAVDGLLLSLAHLLRVVVQNNRN